MKNLKIILGILALSFAICFSLTGTASALGTPASTQISNAINGDTTDTLPQAAGELSVQFTNSNGVDTSYDTIAAAITFSVDTGYDITVTLVGSSSATGQVGDTRFFSYRILNRSNLAIPIRMTDSYVTGNDFGNTNVEYRQGNDIVSSVSLGNGSVNRLTTNIGVGAMDTVYVVFTIPGGSVNGDVDTRVVRLSDRASLFAGETSDLWINGGVVSLGNDGNDTQEFIYSLEVSGPIVLIAKIVLDRDGTDITGGDVSVLNTRPGDTLTYRITIDNDGGAAADFIRIVDAIPSNAQLDTPSFLPDTYSGDAWDGFVTVRVDDNFNDADGDFDSTALTETAIVRVIYTLTGNFGNDLASDDGDGGDAVVNGTVHSGPANDDMTVRFAVKVN